MIRLAALPSSGFDLPVSKRSIELAQTCAKGWIPVSQTNFSNIINKLKSGEYNDKHERLIRDLRPEIGLYLHVLFEALNQGLADGFKSPDKLGIVEKLSIQELSEIILATDGVIGEATIDQMGHYQAQIMRFAYISSTASLLMAERAGIDAAMVYSFSLLRVLSNLLLAWNYPAAFNRAAENRSHGFGNLTDNLERLLKCSILDVSFMLIRGLSLGDSVNTIILSPGDMVSVRPDSLEETGRKLTNLEKAIRFCELGEALARLADSANYPLAAKEWELINKEIYFYLGKHAIELVNEKVELAQNGLLGSHDEIFLKQLEPERDIQTAIVTYNIHRFNRATQGIQMSSSVREMFESVYGSMGFDRPSKEALDIIFKDLLPNLEFEWACFYLLDSKKDQLVPKFSFGKDVWGYNQTISVSTGGEVPRLIFESLNSKAPGRLERNFTDNIVRTHLAWKLGNKSTRGVLYLGSGKSLKNTPARVVMSYFALIRQAICDSLLIENDSSVMLN